MSRAMAQRYLRSATTPTAMAIARTQPKFPKSTHKRCYLKFFDMELLQDFEERRLSEHRNPTPSVAVSLPKILYQIDGP